jgi:hypothetical protein
MGRALEPLASESFLLPNLIRQGTTAATDTNIADLLKDILKLFHELWKRSDDAASATAAMHSNFLMTIHDTFAARLATSDAVEELYRLSTGHLWDEWKRLSAEERRGLLICGVCAASDESGSKQRGRIEQQPASCAP